MNRKKNFTCSEAEGKKDLQDQLKLIKSQSENLKLLINEKMIEIDQKNHLALELRQEIEKLEADVIDKTKVCLHNFLSSFNPESII